MDDLTLRKTIAENLTYYRRAHGLTQAALAETLNYSDKTVSKWERGEGLPDVTVLAKLAEYYGITPNDLMLPRDAVNVDPDAVTVCAEEDGEAALASEEKQHLKSGFTLRTRILVPILSIGLVWLAAMIVFFFLKVISPDFPYSGLIFLYAIPASCIVATVFACLWWHQLFRLLFVSGIVWSVALCLYMTIQVPYIGLIFAVAGVLQALTVLWFVQIRK